MTFTIGYCKIEFMKSSKVQGCGIFKLFAPNLKMMVYALNISFGTVLGVTVYKERPHIVS